jgi:DNA polymerase/3'-5' exonuclease PolX
MNRITSIYDTKTADVSKNAKKTIADIKKKLAAGKIKLTKSQHIAIAYHDDLVKRIPRAEVAKHYDFIRDIIPTAMIAGSYRRGAKTSSDIDIIVRQSISSVVDDLKEVGYIRDIISQGNKKFSGIVKLPGHKTHRHIDIVFTTPRAYPFTMMYFTGSKRFNIIMRLKAKKMGYKLNEYGLWNGLVVVSGITTERDIFKALDTPYVAPEDR